MASLKGLSGSLANLSSTSEDLMLGNPKMLSKADVPEVKTRHFHSISGRICAIILQSLSI